MIMLKQMSNWPYKNNLWMDGVDKFKIVESEII